MRYPAIILFCVLFFLVLPACEKSVRDEFPRRDFIGYFDLRDPRYSATVFSAKRDMDGSWVGINGIIVYRSGDQFYVFDQMCPYEKKTSCSVSVTQEEDPSTAECSCCGSRFWIVEPNGSVAEGPALRGLQTYHARVENNMLVVSSY